MTLAPAVGLLWTLIDIAVCHFSVLHPIYYLVESTILVGLNVAMGIISVMIYRYLTSSSCHLQSLRTLMYHYSYDSDGSWIPGIFIFLTAIA
jgi:hypothetical protein